MVLVIGSSRMVTPSGRVGGLCPMLSLKKIKRLGEFIKLGLYRNAMANHT